MTSNFSDPLLETFELRHLTLHNRVVSTSHEPAYSEDGLPKDRYALYHAEKAKGGIALTMIGGSAVIAPDSPSAFGNLHLYKDEIVPWLSRLADQVHEQGAHVMCQITHLGRRTSNYSGDWLPVIATSPLRERAHRAFPKQAEDWDLARIIQNYADAAVRCKEGGMDGIEIEAYGHLFDGFLSPATNQRDDEWGGSLANRLRFPSMVVQAVRKAVGPKFVIGLRLAVTDDLTGGLPVAEGIAATQKLVADGIDFLSVIKGHIDTDEGLAKVIPPMGTPSAPHLTFTGEIRHAVGIPVMHSSRIADVATARHAVRAGLVDLVGMTRAHMADPHIVKKVMSGKENRIRPCVGAGYCLDQIYQSSDAKCIHNPATGRETKLPHEIPKADEAKRVVVVGAGPAGLEAARVLGERGHTVTVLEASDAPGGQLQLASRLNSRRDLIGITDWRVSECRELGVEIRYNTYADEEMVQSYDPEVVLIATGGIPPTGFDNTIDSWDLLSGTTKVSGTVLLYDDNGGHPGLDTAQAIIAAGARLNYVTPERVFAPDIGGINYPTYAKSFAEAEVPITLLHSLHQVTPAPNGRKIATLYSEYANKYTKIEVDHVVVEQGTLPNADLYFALIPHSTNKGEVNHSALLSLSTQTATHNPAGTYQLFRIGDAVTSRNVHAAIHDAYRLCLAI